MKTFTHLWLDDRGLKAFNAPEKPEPPIFWEQEAWYNKELKQALAEGVYFKNFQIVEQLPVNTIILIDSYKMAVEKHKAYDVPNGYEVRVEKSCEYCYATIGRQDCSCKPYAILVPKEQTNRDRLPFPQLVDEMVKHYENVPIQKEKQQSTIEEAAEAYADSQDRRGTGVWQGMYRGYQAGAKSQAAKEYWYEQFMKMEDIRMFLLSHPNQEMIRTSCLHYLGDRF